MPLLISKPTSPGSRHQVRVSHPHLHKGSPYRPLIFGQSSSGGRNHKGRITVHYRGGGHKRRYRLIDFKRNKIDIPGTVERIEYDPNRSAHVALILYKDGERRYIIAPKGLGAGDSVISGSEAPIKVGSCLPMNRIPYGTIIHCIEMKPGKGAQMIRSAGTAAQLMSCEGLYAIIRLRSGEVRKVLARCFACIGEVSNAERNSIALGKAGASRHLGIRPHVRGVAKNPVDHPMGGGEGKTSGGRHPVSRTGVPAKGYRTRHAKKSSRKFIIRDRRKKK